MGETAGEKDFEAKLRRLRERDPRYPPLAYAFVLEGLEFGPLARVVLSSWSITRTEDFGEIVFNLVEEQLLSRRDEDKKEDFRDGYDFVEAFERGYKIETGGEES